MRTRLVAVSLACSLLAVSTLAAQRDKEPKRPTLPAAADTNNGRTYYQFALQQMKTDPEKAADALYWTTRLEPMLADGFYARRIALLLSDPNRLMKYWNGDRRTIQSDEIKRIDSLFFHALTLNPFVSQVLDRQIFEMVADQIARQYDRTGGGNATAIRFAIDREMMSAPASMRAWLAYGDGRYGDALSLYARAIKGDKRNGPLHSDRARVFYQMNEPDSALAELTAAIDDLRKRDKKDLIYVYQSKALTEQSIGKLESRLGRTDAAKEAFGRALQEDLAYYPAHLELAYLALETKDTTAALLEMDLAVQLRDDDAAAQYIYGFTLGKAGKYAEAESHLRKAIALNPVFASPYHSLGLVLEKSGHKPEASMAYWEFLDRSARTDPRRAEAESHLAAISAGANKPEDHP